MRRYTVGGADAIGRLEHPVKRGEEGGAIKFIPPGEEFIAAPVALEALAVREEAQIGDELLLGPLSGGGVDRSLDAGDDGVVIVHRPEVVLNAFKHRLECLAVLLLETGGEDFQRVAQPFETDAQLVEGLKIGQIRLGAFMHALHQNGGGAAGVLNQAGLFNGARGRADGLHQFAGSAEQAAPGVFAPDLPDVLDRLVTLRSGCADEMLQDGALLFIHVLHFGGEALQVNIAVAGFAGGLADALQPLAHGAGFLAELAGLLFETGAECVDGGAGAARRDAELVDMLDEHIVALFTTCQFDHLGHECEARLKRSPGGVGDARVRIHAFELLLRLAHIKYSLKLNITAVNGGTDVEAPLRTRPTAACSMKCIPRFGPVCVREWGGGGPLRYSVGMSSHLQDAGPESDAPLYLRNLNEAQRQAVLHDAGPLAVLAGPGTGKTRVIVRRIARLVAPVEEGGAGAEPESVLAIAFTIKSAEELRSRLVELVPSRLAMRIGAMTSHSFGRNIVRRYGDVIGLPPGAEVVDSAMIRRGIRALVDELGLFRDRAAEGRETVIVEAMDHFRKCATDAVTPERFSEWCAERRRHLDDGDHDLDPEAVEAEYARLENDVQLARLYEAHERRRLTDGMLTLDDYINLPSRILRESPRVAAMVRDDIRHVLVDEFQDMSPAQIELLTLLCPPRKDGASGPDLCVVGDDDQAIYAFRGADDRAFRRFHERWPGHTTITLEENYRSAAEVIAAANEIIGRAQERFAPDKVIRSPEIAEHRAPPGLVEGVVVDDDKRDTGAAIAAIIHAEREKSGRRYADYAVLARTNTFADEVARELELHGVPVAQRRARSALDDQGVQDLMAWLGLIADPEDGPSAQRLLTRPPLLVSPERVGEWAREHKRAVSEGDTSAFSDWLRDRAPEDERVITFTEMLGHFRKRDMEQTADRTIEEIIHRADLAHAEGLDGRERATRITALVQVLRFVRDRAGVLDPPGGAAAFLAYYADLSDDEKTFRSAGDERVDGDDSDDDDENDAVHVLTAHKAKGLEFDTVFVVRVRPRLGYPQSMRNEEALATELTGREPADSESEERRLFYVACTRAARRLVLTALKKKSRGNAIDYFIELTEDCPDLVVPISFARDILERDDDAVSVMDGADETHAMHEALIRRLIVEARREGVSLLHRAERADVDAATLDALSERLGGAARRLALLAALRDRGAPPDFLAADDGAATLTERLERLRRASLAESLIRPLKAPLSLSYTKLYDYIEACPRCYYLKHVLRLNEPRTQGLVTGVVVHESLESFFRESQAADADGLPAPGVERLMQIAELTYRRHLPRLQVFRPDELEQIRAQLRLAVEKLHDPSSQIVEVEQSVRFAYAGPGGDHTFYAKLDRIDLRQDGPSQSIRLVDYKTGEAYKKYTEPKKDDLQLCVYALALEHLYESDPGALEGAAAEYWVLSTGEKGVIHLDELAVERVRAKIDKAIEGMLAGEFERNEARCRGLCAVLGE
ncbi:MAG: ATP-dependent helicase [Phycisphaeraceae bacterium]|nr:MAG: ATP-dependent helicase [Phycisphaeraceae bacterium]